MTYGLRARVLDVDLSSGNITFPRQSSEAPAYRRALVLVRLHGYPLGIVEVPYDDSDVSSSSKRDRFLERVSEAAWLNYASRITRHLETDGAGPVGSSAALTSSPIRRCSFAPEISDSPAPLISVVIATLANTTAVIECVDHILSSTYPNIEVLVVDNDKNQTDLESVLGTRFAGTQNVRYVWEPRTGLSRARNAGLEEAKGEIIVFTDDDVLVDQHWLAYIAKAFAVRADVTCVTGSILAAELETPAQGWLEQYGGFNKGFDREVFNSTDLKRPGPLYPFDSGRFGSGANIAFRATTIRSMKGFAEDLGAGTPAHGGEDMDILRRVITEGHTLVYEPGALIWHLHRRSYAALQRQLYRYGVGLSATVTKWLLESPKTCGQVLRRMRAGLNHVFRSDSEKNRRKNADYPKQLTTLELLGIVVGPVAYLRSRHQAKRARRPRLKAATRDR